MQHSTIKNLKFFLKIIKYFYVTDPVYPEYMTARINFYMTDPEFMKKIIDRQLKTFKYGRF